MYWHEHLRRAVKLGLTGAAYYSGILPFVRRRVMRHHAVILMYHRVLGPDNQLPDYSPNGMAVTQCEFDVQMAYLQSQYHVVSLSQLIERLRDPQPLPSGWCVVTFDDGWREVYDYAFPVLKRRAIPATVFLATQLIDGGSWYWLERLKYLLAHVHSIIQRDAVAAAAWAARCHPAPFIASLASVTPRQLPQYLNDAAKRFGEIAEPERRALLGWLETTTRDQPFTPPRQFMSWDEIREMTAHGIEFGNHTMTHPDLSQLPGPEAAREVEGAWSRISAILGARPHHFAYPYGKYNAEARAAVAQAGVISACTTRFGLVRKGDDVYALKRINVHSDVSSCRPLFAARMLGL